MRIDTKQEQFRVLMTMTTMMISVVLWIIMGAITAHFAVRRGRNPFIWFAAGALVGVFGLIFLFLLPNKAEESSEADEAVETQEESKQEAAFLQQQEGGGWYYIGKDGVQKGPVTFIEMKNAWNEEKINVKTFVWYNQLKEWKRVEDVEMLEEELEK